MRPKSSLIAALLVVALPLAAKNVTSTDKPVVRELPLTIIGTLAIENPAGSIEVTGSDLPNAVVTAVRTTIAVDKDSLAEGREKSALALGGDANTAIVRTLMPQLRSPRWSVSVKYIVRVPKTVHVNVRSNSADPIHISNILGNVRVNTFSGNIVLDNVSGATVVETVNGKVLCKYNTRVMSHVNIAAVNADIEVHVPPDANFDWVADTVRGDVFTNLPIRGRWSGTTFRGGVNAPGGPTLTTSTMLGRVFVLSNGAPVSSARSLRTPTEAEPVQTGVGPAGMDMRIPDHAGDFALVSPYVNLSAGRIRGGARVEIGGGSIDLGTIWGNCVATSNGGPLTIGEVVGSVIAHTGAGNILVRAARGGGTISTDGGSVRLFYAGASTTLRSGGGDIIVRQAAGAIQADTRSGDIAITSDPTMKTNHIEAHTTRGNVMINLPPGFAADVDATVLTTSNDTEVIHSDFAGLQIRREAAPGGKTRVRATGRINGGGDRLELYAEEGTIHIIATTASPSAVTR